MVDTGLITQELRDKGYTVEHVEAVSTNSGDWIFVVDGTPLNLEQTRALLAKTAAE